MSFRIVLFSVLLSSPALVGAAPFLEGNVQDEQGRPIVGASVKIWDCLGTCFGGTTVLSDAKGNYSFEKKPFQNSPLLSIDLPGRYEVSRTQTGPDLEKPDTSVPRKVDFVLGIPAAASVSLKTDAPEGWTQTLVFRPGRDVKLHRYDFHPSSDAHAIYANFEVLPRNENLHLVVVREPVVRDSGGPKETRELRRANWRSQEEIVSPPIRLAEPQRYEIRAKIVTEKDGQGARVVFESVTDAVGMDRTEESVVKDPQFGPPVDAATREKALELLKRVKAAAVPWNATTGKEIVSYEYDAIDGKGDKTHVKIDRDSPAGPGWSDISRLRGFAYVFPLRWLFSQPENVVFHGVEIKEDRAVLDYQLKSGRGFGAGIGIGPSWNGFFTAGFSAGKLIIDPKTATVLEHRLSRGPLGQESVETFGDYVAVGQGFAPRSLRIQSGGQVFRFTFQVHKGKLWLLDKAFRDEDKEPAFKIENVSASLAE